MQKAPIYEHTLPPSSSLLAVLHRYLPYTIPVLRRLQSPVGFSPTAILLATFPELHDATGSQTTYESEENRETDLPIPFAIGFFDRRIKPNIHGWVFSSIELPDGFSTSGHAIQGLPQQDDAESHAKERQVAANQMLSLFATLARLRPVESIPNDHLTPEDLAREDLAKQAARSLLGTNHKKEDTVFLGSVNAKIESLLLAHPSQPLDRRAPRYLKHVIDVGCLRRDVAKKGSAIGGELPPRMYFAPITAQDYGTVMQHNKLIRHPRNLEKLPSCGIWLSTPVDKPVTPVNEVAPEVSPDQALAGSEDEQPLDEQNETPTQSFTPIKPVSRRRGNDQLIAFAFLGADGCVRALHVDYEFRGQGLGTKVVERLILTENHVFYKGAPLPLPSTTAARGSQGDNTIGQDNENEITDWKKGDMTHTDIYTENDVSIRLFKKFGAVPVWEAIWPTIDLARITAWYDKDKKE